MSKLKAFVALAIAGALIMGGSVPATQAATKTLTVGVLMDVASFAARDSEWGQRNLYYQAVYDSILQQDTTGKLIPSVATSWKYDSSQTILTLQIRKGLKFTDGTALNAAAVVANLKRFSTGITSEKSLLNSMKTAVAKGTDTVVITLNDTDPAFLNYLARTAGLIESPKNFNSATSKTAPVGSGPYTLNKLKTKFGSTYTFVKNPGYWNAKAVKFDNLVLKVLTDPTAAANALKAGQVDAVNLAKPSLFDSLTAAGIKFATQNLDWVGLSIADRSGSMGTPLKNLKVRQAINMAFDRPAMLQGLASGFGTVTTQVFPASSAGYVKALENRYPYDVVAAKKLLAEAGYPNGFTISMPSITALTGPANPALIAAQLKGIGINVNYTDEGISTYVANNLAHKYPLYRMTLERSSNDWQHINFLMSETAIWNTEKYSDSTSAKLIGRIQSATAAARPALLKQLNTYIVEQAWYVPFYAVRATFGYNKKVKVKVQPGNTVPYLFNFTPAS
jgi:peptide/nickel transport system substrate-binding protein